MLLQMTQRMYFYVFFAVTKDGVKQQIKINLNKRLKIIKTKQTKTFINITFFPKFKHKIHINGIHVFF